MSRKWLNAFLGRNRSSAFHSCNDHTLGNVRQSIFQIQGTCSTAECTDTRTVIISNIFLIQNIHLLTNRTVNTWISGMKSDSCLSLCFCLLDHMDHFLQCHFCTVVDGADVLCVFQKLWIYQWSCIDHHISFLQILFSSYCDKIRCSRTCSYEMYHNLSFSLL